MNQAMVPVDGHKEEPQICVIEASMELFCINLRSSGFLSIWSSFIQQICTDASCVLDTGLGGGIIAGNDIDGPCPCGQKSVGKMGIKQGEYS